MPVPASQKGESTEDQIAGYPIGCDDQSACPDSILNQDFSVFCITQSCDEFCVGHTGIHLAVPADIPQPTSGKDTDLC